MNLNPSPKLKTKDLLDQRFRSRPTPDNLSTSIDLKLILEECMGDIELLKELISLYQRNALEFIGAAKTHLQNSDIHALGLAAHKIKPGLAMLRTDSLHSIIALMEKECAGDQDLKHLKFLFDCFVMEYPTIKKSLNLALANLDKV